jgi:hypothetical protein
MKCKEFERYALAYMDGTLARAESDRVERHMAGCSSCAERARGFAGVSRMLDAWEPIRPSASFNARLQQRMLEQPAQSWWERLAMHLGLLPVWRPAAASAVLAVMLFAVLVAQYVPTSPEMISQQGEAPQNIVVTPDTSDELALYQEMSVLENWEMLSNFEVLQELETASQ